MKRKDQGLILGVTICLMLLCGFGAVTAAPGSAETNAWELIKELTVVQPARMAAFYDENFGVTGGFSGKGKASVTVDGNLDLSGAAAVASLGLK